MKPFLSEVLGSCQRHLAPVWTSCVLFFLCKSFSAYLCSALCQIKYIGFSLLGLWTGGIHAQRNSASLWVLKEGWHHNSGAVPNSLHAQGYHAQ